MQQEQLAAAFERLALAANRAAAQGGGTPSWIELCTWPASGAATVGMANGVSGKVQALAKGDDTVYRFTTTPYSAAADAFYSDFTAGVLSGLIVSRG